MRRSLVAAARFQFVMIMPDAAEHVFSRSLAHLDAVAVEFAGLRKRALYAVALERPGKADGADRNIAVADRWPGQASVGQGEIGAADPQRAFGHITRDLFAGQIIEIDGFLI